MLEESHRFFVVAFLLFFSSELEELDRIGCL